MEITLFRKFFAIGICFVIFSCSHSQKTVNDYQSSESKSMERQLEANKTLVLKLYSALNDTNWTDAKKLIDPNFKHHYVKDSAFGVTNWNGFEKGFRMSQKAFPDWKLTPSQVVAQGEYVSVLLFGQGTHRGEFAGIPPTNRKVGAPIMLLHQIKEGKIVADWEIMNTSSFLEQLRKE